MVLNDAFFAISHIATQLVSRWFAPSPLVDTLAYESTLALQKLRDGEGLHELDTADWEDLMIADLSQVLPVLGWLPEMLQRRPSLLLDIAQAAVDHFQGLHHSGGVPVLLSDMWYPSLLKSIVKPPLMLSCLGDLSVLRYPAVAVIGSRQASFFSLQTSLSIGRFLADCPVSVVSGGAIGCDIAVHQGMLASQAQTVRACVVFAGGLSTMYPRRHDPIFEAILRRGGLMLSERLWFQPCRPRDFPIRNRIVSGMSQSVIITQAGEDSGSLITADEALEQGREVYVLEHDRNDVRACGSIKLLDDGAVGFVHAEDLLAKMSGSLYFNNCESPMNWTCQPGQNLGTVEGEQFIN